jgi:hypothetical protein
MEERERVVESLPAEVTWDEMAMPEGDLHTEGKWQAVGALQGYYKQQRRRVYVGMELPIYYPGERRFAPDVLVVLDVEAHLRGWSGSSPAGSEARAPVPPRCVDQDLAPGSKQSRATPAPEHPLSPAAPTSSPSTRWDDPGAAK